MARDYLKYSLRVPPNVLIKFRYLAAHEGRSINSQLLWCMWKCITRYEGQHGEIPLEEPDEQKRIAKFLERARRERDSW